MKAFEANLRTLATVRRISVSDGMGAWKDVLKSEIGAALRLPQNEILVEASATVAGQRRLAT